MVASTPELSLVIPVFNEEASVDLFYTTVAPVLDALTPDWEMLFVNDGSRDTTLERLRALNGRDGRVRVLDFSRNFGKEAALSAGLDHANGCAVVPIDVDLQDPPAVLIEMVALWRGGAEVVLARRSDRSSDGLLKRRTAAFFYGLIGRISNVPIPADVGDFRLMDARVVAALRTYPERERFMKGLFASVGFRTATVDYIRPPRVAGLTKFNARKLIGLGVEGVVSFTTVPLKIWTYIGFAAALLGMAYAAYVVLRTMIYGIDVPGYASLIAITLVSNGLVLIGLGMVGEYLARVFSEVKARPLYIVRETIGG